VEYPFSKQEMVYRFKSVKKIKKMTPHYHEIHELYYMMEGRTNYIIENEIFGVQQGDLVFVPKGLIHGTDYGNCKVTERIVISFPEKYFVGETQALREQMMNMRVICIGEEHRHQVEAILMKIEEEFLRREFGRESLLELYVKELLVLICRYHQERKAYIKESDKIIYEVSKYIQEHFGEELTLTGLSKYFAVSESFLSRKFKAVTGVGLNQYLTIVRINNGARLLQETKLSITKVAEKCGFSDSNYFSSVFKKLKGVTPLHYRKQKGV